MGTGTVYARSSQEQDTTGCRSFDRSWGRASRNARRGLGKENSQLLVASTQAIKGVRGGGVFGSPGQGACSLLK